MVEGQKAPRFLGIPCPPEMVRVPPEARGLAYRFAILLPVLSEGREVFRGGDVEDLIKLLTADFGGCTYTPTVTHPLLEGTWEDQAGRLIYDKHAQFVVYTSQTRESEGYFLELQQRLQAHGQQEKVLIEQTTVRLL